MHKQVNGKRVELSAAEVAEYEARQLKHASEAPQRAEEEVDAKRVKAYPKIGDQLDAILKSFEQMKANGIFINEELDAIIAQWRQVKVDNPKP